MKSEINSRQDIKFIIVTFYDKLIKDELMLPFFEELGNTLQ